MKLGVLFIEAVQLFHVPCNLRNALLSVELVELANVPSLWRDHLMQDIVLHQVLRVSLNRPSHMPRLYLVQSCINCSLLGLRNKVLRGLTFMILDLDPWGLTWSSHCRLFVYCELLLV